MNAPTQHLTIITGASRGMGLAMALARLSAGHQLVCIARQANDALSQAARAADLRCEQWTHDLAQPEAAGQRLLAFLQQQTASNFASVTLINNAGMIPHIAPLDDVSAADLSKALRVGLEAPMVLSGAFLQGTAHWPGQRKVLNVSSGLGRRAMASQAAYCAAKAGMDHFTRCVALEQAVQPNGAKVCSLAPGVIDTDMQTQLRGASADAFSDRGSFIALKESGALMSPEDAAQRVLARLDRNDFGNSPVADIRE